MNKLDLKAMENLAKVNLDGYFNCRKNGMNHNDALTKLLKSRYFIERGKQQKVMALWSETRALISRSDGTTSKKESDELRYLLNYMYIVETHLDRVDTETRNTYNMAFRDIFNELFELIKAKYN